MADFKGFIISLIAASAASAVLEGFLPDSDGKGGMKKYLKYLISLAILLTLLSPLKGLISSLPTLVASAADIDAFAYGSVDAIAKANSIVALRIGEAVCDKFSLDGSEVSVLLTGEVATITLTRHFGIFESDIQAYIAANFGITAEVVFDE